MKYRVVAADEVYARMLKLELDRLGLTEAREGSADFSLCVAEGQTELPRSRGLSAAVLIDCGLLAARLPEKITVKVLDRPFALTEFREFVSGLEDVPGSEENTIVLYPDELSVGYGDNISQLTHREFELFSYFFARPYITISRSELLKTIWKDENEPRDQRRRCLHKIPAGKARREVRSAPDTLETGARAMSTLRTTRFRTR